VLAAALIACGRIGYDVDDLGSPASGSVSGAGGFGGSAMNTSDQATSGVGTSDGGSAGTVTDAGLGGGAGGATSGTGGSSTSVGAASGAGGTSRGGAGGGASGGASTTDAGSDGNFPVPANSTCSAPIVLSPGVPSTGTTCGSTDTVTSACAPAGTPDVYFSFTVPANVNYQIVVTDGFSTFNAMSACGKGGGCTQHTASSVLCFNGLGMPRMPQVAVERTSGGCGPFTIEVRSSPQCP
jgi:hypothetical protein